MPNNSVDKDALSLTRAIALAESGGKEGKPNYNAVGDNGTSKGAYQWQPGNYEAAAKEAGIDPADFSPTSQDKVAYYQVKKYKDKGYQPWEIASLWNSGSPDKWKDHKGTTVINGKPIAYDTPAYVNKVKQNYLSLSQGQPVIPQANTTAQPQDEQGTGILPNLGKIGSGLVSNISNRITDLGKSTNPVTERGLGGLPSTLIQGAGAIAGGVGDVINAGLQLIPGVQAGEELLGKGVQKLADTETGKEITASMQALIAEHPEFAKDVEAGINIASLIPLFKGLSIGKAAATDATTVAFKNSLEKGAIEEIKGILPTKAARSVATAEARGLKPIDQLVKEQKYLPQVVENPATGRHIYSSERGAKELQRSLEVDEDRLQELLKKGINRNVGISIEQTRQKVLNDIAQEYQLSGNYTPAVKAVNDYFDSIKASSKGRDYIDLNELNEIKRDVRSAVNFDNLSTKSSAVKYQIGQSLMSQIEEVAQKAGIEGVPAINKLMGQKLEALKILKAIDGRSVKGGGGLFREGAADIAGVVGEAAGNTVGVPLAGTFAGRGLARSVLRRPPPSKVGKLSRTRTTPTTRRTGLVQLGLGSTAQGLVRPPQEER